MDTSNDEHRQLQADYGIPPPPAPQLPAPPPPFADFDFTFTPGPVPQMSSFSELQSLHSQSMLATTPHGAFDASGIFDFNFGSAPSHGGGNLSVGGPPGSDGVPPLLLSSTEETSLLGFLDKFGGDGFEFGPVKGMPEYPKHLDPPAGLSGQGGTSSSHHGGLGLDVHPLQMHQSSSSTAGGHHGTPTTISPHETSNFNVNAFALRPHSSSFSQPPPPTTPSIPTQAPSSPREVDPSPRPSKRRKSSVTDSASKDTDQGPPTPSGSSAASKAARKPLLTEPQKRWNHIQSEQRRRTVIKENFSTLETLVAADKRYKGPHPTLPVPLDANGKPKKGVRAKSLRGKGKMGTLFRAAEFIAYLEEGVDALSLEVERLEAAAATYQQQQHQMQVQGQNAMTGVVHYPLR
ncbi:hypothetical protein M407DRAFT_244153 [Tulasnella calospora MUT 4182]|uniref:BHLH domain-containing protein n=1 Tax=Tulasnella calospora MUT 4182 TaxID=1051891 RepID=A0A0C3LV17_9AGAM|nr:hypothetical protein M407DRAFT_244153 [Tulasnella calospora MUT 4182]